MKNLFFFVTVIIICQANSCDNSEPNCEDIFKPRIAYSTLNSVRVIDENLATTTILYESDGDFNFWGLEKRGNNVYSSHHSDPINSIIETETTKTTDECNNENIFQTIQYPTDIYMDNNSDHYLLGSYTLYKITGMRDPNSGSTNEIPLPIQDPFSLSVYNGHMFIMGAGELCILRLQDDVVFQTDLNPSIIEMNGYTTFDSNGNFYITSPGKDEIIILNSNTVDNIISQSQNISNPNQTPIAINTGLTFATIIDPSFNTADNKKGPIGIDFVSFNNSLIVGVNRDNGDGRLIEVSISAQTTNELLANLDDPRSVVNILGD